MASLQQERAPPPSYSSHDPDSLDLPSVPQQAVGSPNSNATSVTLPHLSSLGLPDSNHGHYTADSKIQQWQPSFSVSPTAFPAVPNTAPKSEASGGSPMEISSVMSVDDHSHSHSVSIEDPDVRMAAEALSGLGNPDFARSPTSSYRGTTLSAHQSSATITNASTVRQTPQPHSNDPEPLLTLLTSSHPWLGATVNGSLYAYGGAKHYSPRFVRGTAEFMERNIGSPMVSTVGFVSRQTGVDGRIRRYLGSGRMSDEDKNGSGSKRRRVMGGVASPNQKEVDDVEAQNTMDVAMASPKSENQRMRTGSQSSMSVVESLPAYDDNRSPRYEELSPTLTAENAKTGESSTSQQEHEQQQQRSWQGQLLMTTSGLGVALSESSLRSLKFSLSVLRGASDQVGNVMRALKIVLDEYQQYQSSHQSAQSSTNEKSTHQGEQQRQPSPSNEEQSRRLAERIKTLSDSLWSVLRQTINTISQYTGSALPDNAASLVRRQFLSLPQRWRAAASTSGSRNGSAGSGDHSTTSATNETENQAVMAANRIMNFGQESLDMLSQVSLVVSGTIESAEQWLDSLGRRRDTGEANGHAGASGSGQMTNGLPPALVAGQPFVNGETKER